jgi:hypothetical protein
MKGFGSVTGMMCRLGLNWVGLWPFEVELRDIWLI